MKAEHYILDLDNTLYDYNGPHKKAMAAVLDNFSNEFALAMKKTVESFKIARQKTHSELLHTAASHNRLLYFQKMLELNGINSLEYAMFYYNLYWDTFLENMVLYESAKVFLLRIKNAGLGVCLLTDLTAHIQYRKIERLGLSEFVDFVVTSEEVGVEKPDAKMFKTALGKLNCNHDQALMIGDNWEKDILGAAAMELKAIWINHDQERKEIPENVIEVHNFEEINRL
ncbi:MAG: HAD family hydrolase [Flavobacteriaceae bacterium]